MDTTRTAWTTRQTRGIARWRHQLHQAKGVAARKNNGNAENAVKRARSNIAARAVMTQRNEDEVKKE